MSKRSMEDSQGSGPGRRARMCLPPVTQLNNGLQRTLIPFAKEESWKENGGRSVGKEVVLR